MKKGLTCFLSLICFFFIAACGDKSGNERSVFEGVPISNEDYNSVLDTNEIYEKATADESEETYSVKQEERLEFSSLEEMFRQLDARWNEGEGYQEAIKAYTQVVNGDYVERIKREMNYGFGDARFAPGYIDEDDIPELFLSYGDGHVNGVHIFTYLSSSEEVTRIGEFSSFGEIVYAQGKNRILSQYGNHGFYMDYVSSIEAGLPKLIGMAISDGSGFRHEGIVGFYGFSIPDGVDGSRDGFNRLGLSELDAPDDYEDYLISDEEESRIVTELMDNPSSKEYQYMRYRDMFKVLLGNEAADR